MWLCGSARRTRLDCVATQLEDINMVVLQPDCVSVKLAHLQLEDRHVHTLLGGGADVFPRLARVDLAHNLLSSLTTRLLLIKCTQITHINLSHNPIENEGAAHIAALIKYNTLIDLRLAYCDIDVTGIAKALKKNESVVYVDLSGNSCDRDTAKDLAKALISNQTIQVLKFPEDLEGTNYRFYAETIVWSNSIKSVSFEYCSFPQIAAERIYRAVDENPLVTEIEFLENEFSRQDLLRLNELLLLSEFSKRCTSLTLSHSQINDEIAVAFLFKSFGKMKSLTRLDLSFNQFTHIGLEALIKSLNRITVKELVLSGNPMGCMAPLLITKCKSLSSLSLLGLSRVQTLSEDIGKFGENLCDLMNLTSLEVLDIRSNNLGNTGAELFARGNISGLNSLDICDNGLGLSGVLSILDKLYQSSIQHLSLDIPNQICFDALMIRLPTLPYLTSCPVPYWCTVSSKLCVYLSEHYTNYLRACRYPLLRRLSGRTIEFGCIRSIFDFADIL
jgi:Ran GTPase-activating protein (RanGAP) involved in mRNA processing and transport